jgi:hypothetical protein
MDRGTYISFLERIHLKDRKEDGATSGPFIEKGLYATHQGGRLYFTVARRSW